MSLFDRKSGFWLTKSSIMKYTFVIISHKGKKVWLARNRISKCQLSSCNLWAFICPPIIIVNVARKLPYTPLTNIKKWLANMYCIKDTYLSSSCNYRKTFPNSFCGYVFWSKTFFHISKNSFCNYSLFAQQIWITNDGILNAFFELIYSFFIQTFV